MQRSRIEFGADPTIDFVFHKDGSLRVEIYDAWYGDSEIGFGAALSVRLPAAQIAELRKSLDDANPEE